MAKLRRFDDHLKILKVIVGALLLLAVLGAILMVLRSQSGSAQVTSTNPSPLDSVGIPAVSAGTPDLPAASPVAPVAPASPDVPAAASPLAPLAPASPDGPVRPVSSDDPLPAPAAPASPAPPSTDGIDSFEACAAAGYPIAESYPEQCFVPGGRSFTRSIPAEPS